MQEYPEVIDVPLSNAASMLTDSVLAATRSSEPFIHARVS